MHTGDSVRALRKAAAEVLYLPDDAEHRARFVAERRAAAYPFKRSVPRASSVALIETCR